VREIITYSNEGGNTKKMNENHETEERRKREEWERAYGIVLYNTTVLI